MFKKKSLYYLITATMLFSINSILGREVECECSKDMHFRTLEESWTEDTHSVCKKLYDYILQTLPEGSTMVELGSGWASEQFSKHYKLYSVEHDEKWVGKYNTNYIYAPIIDGWYSIDALKENLPKDHDLILVDGPPGKKIGRGKFFNNLDLFNTKAIIIFDDIQRKPDYKLMIRTAKLLNREIKTVECGKKKFGCLLKMSNVTQGEGSK